MVKSGTEHKARLRDGRDVFINGRRVGDVQTDPSFRRVIESVGSMFDFASAPENRELMTFETPTGERANRIWQLPNSHADLVQRRAALESWTGLHAGFLGRAPDHVASCISGMFMGLDVFESY